MGHWQNDIWQWKTEVTCLIFTSPTTNPVCTILKLNPGFRGEDWAIRRLNSGTVLTKILRKCLRKGRAIAQAISSGFSPPRSEFEPRSDHVEFVVDKVALRQVFSEYFGFPCQLSSHRLLYIHHHPSSRAGTMGKLVADLPSGLIVRLTAPQETKKKILGEYEVSSSNAL
jgi:hypothetical protein